MATFTYVVVSIVLSVVVSDVVAGTPGRRIVDGSFASIAHHPHSVFLIIEIGSGKGEKDRFACGASILIQDVLLTAAHCIEGIKGGWFQIHAFAGHENYEKSIAVRSVKKFYMHNYDEITSKNDIALLFLHRALPLGKYTKRVSISKKSPTNTQATVAGWGLDENDQMLAYLKQARQQILTARQCKHLLPGLMCTRIIDGATNIGDSGSALMVQYQQVGIVSFSMNDEPNNEYYTDVPYHYNWIQEHAKLLTCNTLK